MSSRPLLLHRLGLILLLALVAAVTTVTAANARTPARKHTSPRRQAVACSAAVHRTKRHARRRHKLAHTFAKRSPLRLCRVPKPPSGTTATQGGSVSNVPSPTPVIESTDAAAPVTPPSPTTGGLRVGIVANTQGWGGAGTGPRLDQVINKTGAHWMREEFRWSLIEPSRGTFDFSYYDHWMDEAIKRNVHVVPLLQTAPGWVGPSIPTDPTDYADYVAHVVARYGPHGSYWTAHPDKASLAPAWFELWNEPYQPGGNNNQYDPPRYARLVKAATTAGRKADPAAKFMLEAEVTGVLTGRTWVSWIDALYAAMPNLNDYFDGVAIHPYGDDVTGLFDQGWGQFRRTERMHDAFVKHGATTKPFWLTEVGYSTCSLGTAGKCMSEAAQATNVQTIFNTIRNRYASFVAGVFYYHYEDWRTNNADRETRFGLVRPDGSAKPALAVFKAQAAL